MIKKRLSIDNNLVVNHLWYMDDLKLFANKKKNLYKLLDCVGKFITDEVQS